MNILKYFLRVVRLPFLLLFWVIVGILLFGVLGVFWALGIPVFGMLADFLKTMK